MTRFHNIKSLKDKLDKTNDISLNDREDQTNKTPDTHLKKNNKKPKQTSFHSCCIVMTITYIITASFATNSVTY